MRADPIVPELDDVFTVGPVVRSQPGHSNVEDSRLQEFVRSSVAPRVQGNELWQAVDAWLQLQGALGGTGLSDSSLSEHDNSPVLASLQQQQSRGGGLAPTVYRVEQVANLTEIAMLR